ncbi:MAG: hypothetical protein SGPRY_008565 [Prymnesium sp.]
MVALEHRHTPTVIALSRQGVPNLPGSSIEAVAKGAYIVQPSSSPPLLTLVGTGSEVGLLIDATKGLGVEANVVSMPSWELFDAQPYAYRTSVFLPGVPVLACEALAAEGWSKYAHSVIGMRSFGASGPAKEVQKKFGFTVDHVQAKARELLDFYSSRPVRPGKRGEGMGVVEEGVPNLLERIDAPP